MFRQFHDEQPAPIGGWSVKLLSEVDAPEIALKMTRVEANAPVLDSPYFFSSDGQVADGNPSITSEEEGSMIFTFARAEFGPKEAEGLPGLIAYGPEQDRCFVSISP